MRDFHLRFALSDIADLREEDDYDDGWYDNDDYAMFDLVKGEVSDVPDEPGAYVLGTADGTMLVYPWGLSPVYYIGKAMRLHARLSDHRKYTQRALDDHTPFWRPRIQYGAAFGAHAVWYTVGDMDPQNIEATLINSFYRTYGSIPAANQSWPRWVNTDDEDEA